MKKFNYKILLLGGVMTVLAACNLEETNINPNNATDATVDILLPAAQTNIIFGTSGETGEYASILIQQMTGTLSDFQDVMNYSFLNEFFDFSWNQRLYAGALVDLETIIEKSNENGATHYRGVARILTALALGNIVDNWNDAPFSTALDLVGNPQPTYDDAADLYVEIQELLDLAIADLQLESTISPAGNDFIYRAGSQTDWVANSAPKWIKVARALKARYHNHLSKVDPTGSANDALASIRGGTFVGNEDDANIDFGADQAGPWFSFLSSTFGQNNIAVCQTFVELLRDRVAPGVDDPRIEFYLQDNGGGLYNGVPYGQIDIPSDVTLVGDYINRLDAPTNIITYTEVKFIEAEANFRLNNFGEAAEAFNEAVKSSILRVTGEANPVYEAQYASEDAASIQVNGLEKIFTEKHIALFLEPEAWVDWRRSIPAGADGTVSGIPNLAPSATNETGGVFPRRFLYPQSEIINNSSNVPPAVNTDKVFWDR